MGHQYHALADGPDRLEQTWCTREGTSVRIDSSPRTREAQMRFCVFTIQRWISLAVIIVLVLIEVTAVTNVRADNAVSLVLDWKWFRSTL